MGRIWERMLPLFAIGPGDWSRGVALGLLWGRPFGADWEWDARVVRDWSRGVALGLLWGCPFGADWAFAFYYNNPAASVAQRTVFES